MRYAEFIGPHISAYVPDISRESNKKKPVGVVPIFSLTILWTALDYEHQNSHASTPSLRKPWPKSLPNGPFLPHCHCSQSVWIAQWWIQVSYDWTGINPTVCALPGQSLHGQAHVPNVVSNCGIHMRRTVSLNVSRPCIGPPVVGWIVGTKHESAGIGIDFRVVVLLISQIGDTQ